VNPNAKGREKKRRKTHHPTTLRAGYLEESLMAGRGERDQKKPKKTERMEKCYRWGSKKENNWGRGTHTQHLLNAGGLPK